MPITSADLAHFYNLQRETIAKAQNSESYGLTKAERLKLRRVLGYEGDNAKSMKVAGAFTRRALNLQENENEQSNNEKNENNRQNNNANNDDHHHPAARNQHGGASRSMGDVPRIFSEVSNNY